MPTGGLHLCVAKVLEKYIKIQDIDAFYIGNVAPDSWRHTSSTKEGTHFLTNILSYDYNYELFFNKYKSYLDNNDFVLGYLIHLMTDKYWYSNNFITTIVNPDEYRDLNKACSELMCIYKLKPLKLKEINNPIEEFDSLGIEMAINYNNRVNFLDEMDSKYDIDELIDCINKTTIFIINELDKLKTKEKIKMLT